jgi:hypothetical protein
MELPATGFRDHDRPLVEEACLKHVHLDVPMMAEPLGERPVLARASEWSAGSFLSSQYIIDSRDIKRLHERQYFARRLVKVDINVDKSRRGSISLACHRYVPPRYENGSSFRLDHMRDVEGPVDDRHRRASLLRTIRARALSTRENPASAAG